MLLINSIYGNMKTIIQSERRREMRVTKHKTKIQVLLTVLVVLSVVRQFFLGNYHNMFLGMLTLLLFMVPQFVDKKLGVTLPIGVETVILIFIFCVQVR